MLKIYSLYIFFWFSLAISVSHFISRDYSDCLELHEQFPKKVTSEAMSNSPGESFSKHCSSKWQTQLEIVSSSCCQWPKYCLAVLRLVGTTFRGGKMQWFWRIMIMSRSKNVYQQYKIVPDWIMFWSITCNIMYDSSKNFLVRSDTKSKLSFSQRHWLGGWHFNAKVQLIVSDLGARSFS